MALRQAPVAEEVLVYRTEARTHARTHARWQCLASPRQGRRAHLRGTRLQTARSPVGRARALFRCTAFVQRYTTGSVNVRRTAPQQPLHCEHSAAGSRQRAKMKTRSCRIANVSPRDHAKQTALYEPAVTPCNVQRAPCDAQHATQCGRSVGWPLRAEPKVKCS